MTQNQTQVEENQILQIDKKIKEQSVHLYAGGEYGDVHVWNMKYMKIEKTYEKLMSSYIFSMALTRDKSELFVSDE